MTTLEDIRSDFALLDEWEDRYRYIIELGRQMTPMPDALKTESTKVRGCASQVWLYPSIEKTAAGADPRLTFLGDSDAHIVRGLVAILLAIYNGRSAQDIANHDPAADFGSIGLQDHLTPQRSNGLASMVERVRAEARDALKSA